MARTTALLVALLACGLAAASPSRRSLKQGDGPGLPGLQQAGGADFSAMDAGPTNLGGSELSGQGQGSFQLPVLPGIWDFLGGNHGEQTDTQGMDLGMGREDNYDQGKGREDNYDQGKGREDNYDQGKGREDNYDQGKGREDKFNVPCTGKDCDFEDKFEHRPCKGLMCPCRGRECDEEDKFCKDCPPFPCKRCPRPCDDCERPCHFCHPEPKRNVKVVVLVEVKKKVIPFCKGAIKEACCNSREHCAWNWWPCPIQEPPKICKVDIITSKEVDIISKEERDVDFELCSYGEDTVWKEKKAVITDVDEFVCRCPKPKSSCWSDFSKPYGV